MEIQSKKLLMGGSKGMFIIGSRPSVFSKNGTEWSYISNLPMDMYVYGAVYGNNKFVLTGQNTTNKYCMYSSNGKNWYSSLITTEQAPSTNMSPFLSFAGDKFYYSFRNTSSKSAVYYSYDAVNWSKLTIPDTGSTMQGGWRIGYFNGKYVATAQDQVTGVSGTGIQFFHSNDGFNWAVGTRYTGDKSERWGGGFTIGTDRILKITPVFTFLSTDGVNFQQVSHGFPSSTTWYSVAFGNGKFYCIGSRTAFLRYSTDGVNWTDVSSSLPSSGWDDITYGKKGFVAVGEEAVIHSPDGTTWSAASSLPSGFGFTHGVCWGGK